MAEKKNIYETIAAVMADVGAVGKTSRNQQQNFMFRGIDAVMNALNPAMVKHHLFVIPEVLDHKREERQSVKSFYNREAGVTEQKTTNLIYSICTIKYTFYAEDGSSVSAVIIGEGMDSGDKATNKAMSIAFKYACFQVFCIPTEEMKEDDPDRESHEVQPRKQATVRPAAQKPAERATNAPKQASPEQQSSPAKPALACAGTQERLIAECARTGYDIGKILKAKGVQTPDMLTEKYAISCINGLKGMPDKKPETNAGFKPYTPEGEDEGMRF